MDKETLSNYGWIVICTLVLAVMLALATPFGEFIGGAFRATFEGFGNVTDKALAVIGIGNGGNGGSGEQGGETPDEPSQNECEHLNKEYISIDNDNHMVNCNDCNQTIVDSEAHNFTNGICSGCNHEWQNVIPVGATYTMADGTVLTEGQEFPEIVSVDDVYADEYYKYTYKSVTAYTGWNVVVLDKNLPSYGEIDSYIAGEPVVSMDQTFNGCKSLTQSPKIPDTVTRMSRTFYQSGLKVAPAIPSGVTYFAEAFKNCKSLEDASAVVLSENVTEVKEAFAGCSALTKLPDYSKATSVTRTYGFLNCTSLVDASGFVIPENATNIASLFNRCTSLKTAPVIPSWVTTIGLMFNNCTSLTGEVVINTNPTEYANCFYGVDFQAQHLTLTGSCDDATLDLIGATGTNYCAECNGYCHGHNSEISCTHSNEWLYTSDNTSYDNPVYTHTIICPYGCRAAESFNLATGVPCEDNNGDNVCDFCSGPVEE